jgi:hypothetical protein
MLSLQEEEYCVKINYELTGYAEAIYFIFFIVNLRHMKKYEGDEN